MIRSFILCFAAAVMLTAPAAAQDARPTLRASVTVTGDLVRIGDLVENAGPVADIPIFRAPDLGTRGTVLTEKVIEAIRPHQLIGIDTHGLNEVVVIRATREISPAQISARIAKALEGQYGLGAAHNIQVEFDREPRTLNVEPTSTGELQVVSLSYNARSGRFDATLDLSSSAAMRNLNTRFTGIATETLDAVSVDHPIERGEVLKASDLVITRRPKSEGPVITDIHAAAGLAARHQLRPGQALHEADLMKPLIVQRNDTVTIVYEAPGISLTLRGQAQDAGALGDTIGVANSQSKRIIQGVISGPRRVTVSSPHIRFVENTPPTSPPAAPSLFETQQHEHSVE
jgi:flagellar basal body P-ring formation protein FlgA